MATAPERIMITTPTVQKTKNSVLVGGSIVKEVTVINLVPRRRCRTHHRRVAVRTKQPERPSNEQALCGLRERRGGRFGLPFSVCRRDRYRRRLAGDRSGLSLLRHLAARDKHAHQRRHVPDGLSDPNIAEPGQHGPSGKA